MTVYKSKTIMYPKSKKLSTDHIHKADLFHSKIIDKRRLVQNGGNEIKEAVLPAFIFRCGKY